MKSGDGLGPAAPLCHGQRETDGVGGTDGEDSSELRPGQQSKTHSPCRAGPFPSKNDREKVFMMMFHGSEPPAQQSFSMMTWISCTKVMMFITISARLLHQILSAVAILAGALDF